VHRGPVPNLKKSKKILIGSDMKKSAKIRRVIILAVGLVISGCASVPEPQGLQPGTWELETSDGQIVDVEVREVQGWDYYFDAGTHPISGVYTLQGDSVLMQKPDNPRMKNYSWNLREDRSLVLVDEPPVELTGVRLVSSTLVGPK